MVYLVSNDKLDSFDKKNKKVLNESNIHNSLKFFMIFSQILGVLPQENILRTVDKIHFRWGSWKVAYTLTTLFLTAFAIIMCFCGWFSIGYTFTALGKLIKLIVTFNSRKFKSYLTSSF